MSFFHTKPRLKLSQWTLLFFGFFVFADLLSAHGWKAPTSASDQENPIPDSSQAIVAGKNVYQKFCLSCHGADAQGMSKKDAGLETSPPDLPKRLAGHSDGDFFWKIQQGRGEMPGFKETLEEREIWQTILYLRELIK